MFERTPQSNTHRPRPHTRSVTGSLLLAAAVPAALWASSHPLATAVVVALAVTVAVGVRTLRARFVDRSATGRPTVTAADPADGS